MKLWIKYALSNAIIGALIGLYLALISGGEGFDIFIYTVPLAAFVTGGLFWKFIVGNVQPLRTTRIVIAGLLTGTVSHYVAFIFVSIIMNVCYWTSGGCTGSLGDPPASILAMLTGAFGFSFFSLLWFGWISVPASVIIGLVLKRVEK